MAKDWKEGEHPRDEEGRFTKKNAIEMSQQGYSLHDFFNSPEEVHEFMKKHGITKKDLERKAAEIEIDHEIGEE